MTSVARNTHMPSAAGLVLLIEVLVLLFEAMRARGSCAPAIRQLLRR